MFCDWHSYWLVANQLATIAAANFDSNFTIDFDFVVVIVVGGGDRDHSFGFGMISVFSNVTAHELSFVVP